MVPETEPLLLPTLHPEQRKPPPANRAWGRGLAITAVVVLLLLSTFGPLHRRGRLLGAPLEPVALTLLAGATEKGAVCLDGTPQGYHLQRGSGSGSSNWIMHLEGGGWCSTLKDCSNRRMTALGSSNFMKPIQFAGAGIFDSDQQLNPDFYNWNKVYVRYCDGASFSGDTEGQAPGGGWCSTMEECSNKRTTVFGSSNFMRPIRFATAILDSDPLQNPDFYNWNKVYVRYCDGGVIFWGRGRSGAVHFRGLRIYEAVIAELMEKGIANATQALFTGCSAGGLSAMLHCDDFSARFSQEVSVKCLIDAGLFLDVKDISGERSLWSVYDGVVHLQNVRKVLPKDCLANKEPTECFFPAELIKSIRTPTFILNSGYDSWQIRNVIAPVSSAPDNSWLSCKDNIRNCTSTQIEVLDGFRNTMVNDLKVIKDKDEWGMFIDSCFTHCQTLSRFSWNSPTSPRLGNKTIAEAIGDWHSGRNHGVKEIDCKYPCNPTCSSQLPT